VLLCLCRQKSQCRRERPGHRLQAVEPAPKRLRLLGAELWKI